MSINKNYSKLIKLMKNTSYKSLEEYISNNSDEEFIGKEIVEEHNNFLRNEELKNKDKKFFFISETIYAEPFPFNNLKELEEHIGIQLESSFDIPEFLIPYINKWDYLFKELLKDEKFWIVEINK